MLNNIRFLLMAALVLLTACEKKPDASSDVHEKKLMVIISPDNPPFEGFDSVKQEIVGFDVDLTHLIAKELGAKLEIVPQDFSTLIPSIQTGKADFAISQFSITPERAQAVDFSVPYLKTAGALVVGASSSVHTPNDLQDKVLGVQMGSTFAQAAELLKEKIPGLSVQLYNKATEMVEEVKNGRIQAALLDETAGAAFAKVHNELHVVLLDDEITTQTLSVVLPKNSPHGKAVNAAIERLEKSGEIAKLKAKWLTKE